MTGRLLVVVTALLLSHTALGQGGSNLCPSMTDEQLAQAVKGRLNLQQLDLRRSRITDSGLSPLTGLTRLRVLNLSGTRITDAGL